MYRHFTLNHVPLASFVPMQSWYFNRGGEAATRWITLEPNAWWTGRPILHCSFTVSETHKIIGCVLLILWSFGHWDSLYVTRPCGKQVAVLPVHIPASAPMGHLERLLCSMTKELSCVSLPFLSTVPTVNYLNNFLSSIVDRFSVLSKK